MKTIPFSEIEILPDMNVDERLMPSGMGLSTNREEIMLYSAATRVAMKNFLTPEQRDIIKKHYYEGMSKTDIGRQLGITPSTVCKKINLAIKILQRQAEYLLDVRRVIKRIGDD